MAAHFTLPCWYSVFIQVALLFGSVIFLGDLDKGATSGIWPDRGMGIMIVLESFWLGLSQRLNKESADIRLLGTLLGVYTHTINATD